MITRRAFTVAPLGLSACATAPEDAAHAFLRRAINVAGGEPALRRARVLAWTGRAVVHAGGRNIEIGVDTVVEPFVYARSETWLPSQGRSSARILEIDGAQGWVTRDGRRTPMPAAMLAHERQQYAIYGLMRLVTLLDSGADFEPAPLRGTDTEPPQAFLMTVTHPNAPRCVMLFDANFRLARLLDTVSSPEGSSSLAQAFQFANYAESDGVWWPRQISILQREASQEDADYSPFFDLTLDTFTPRQQR